MGGRRQPGGEPLRGHTVGEGGGDRELAGEQVIVSGGGEGTVHVWAGRRQPRGEPLRGHDGWVIAVAIGTLAGEQVIVSGGDDGTVRVWAADGSPRGEPLRGHDGG